MWSQGDSLSNVTLKHMKTTRYLLASSVAMMTLLVASPALADSKVSANGLLQSEGHAGLNLGLGLRSESGRSNDRDDSSRDRDNQSSSHRENEDKKMTVSGTVSAVSGSTITLAGNNGITYTIDASNAEISDRNDASIIGNVAVGDTLIVKGKLNGTVITAKKIRDVTFVHRSFLSAIGAAGAGVVTSKSGSSFTLKSRGMSGTTTVTTNASTTYKVNGVATTSGALSVGSRAIVFGSTDSSGGITATIVSILNAGARFFVHLF